MSVEQEPKPKTLALLFPGQGLTPETIFACFEKLVQKDKKRVENRFSLASEVTGLPLLSWLKLRNESRFEMTSVSQPVIYTLSVLAYETTFPKKDDTKNSTRFVAGHSLGEYTALTAADVFSFEDGIRLVAQRGKLMQEACQENPSALISILGLEEKDIEAICRQTQTKIALLNAPRLIVVGGKINHLPEVEKLAKEKGARRIVQLQTTGAFHTPLMAGAAHELAKSIASLHFQDAKPPVVTNLTAQAWESGSTLKGYLVESMVSPVKWATSLDRMRRAGVELFLELGPGNSLTSLNRQNGIPNEQSRNLFF